MTIHDASGLFCLAVVVAIFAACVLLTGCDRD